MEETRSPQRRRLRSKLALAGAAAGTLLLTFAVSAAPASADTGGSLSGYGGLCLDVRGANSANYTPVQIYTCNGTNAQHWDEVSSGSTLRALGKCLDVNGGRTGDGTPVDLFDCNGTGAQVWIPQGNGAFFNPQSNKCLDDTNWSTSSGTQAQIWDCSGNANQSWSFASLGRD